MIGRPPSPLTRQNCQIRGKTTQFLLKRRNANCINVFAFGGGGGAGESREREKRGIFHSYPEECAHGWTRNKASRLNFVPAAAAAAATPTG